MDRFGPLDLENLCGVCLPGKAVSIHEKVLFGIRFDMMDEGRRVMLCVLLLTAVCSFKTAPTVYGVVQEPETGRVIKILDTEVQISNPHSDLIFRATGATSCRDCHGIGKSGVLIAKPMDNDLVRALREKAKGIHGPGRFADCLRCHAGGSKGVEKY
jgi:hypothetical protein